jgi:uncharacterized protein (DUF433 family)
MVTVQPDKIVSADFVPPRYLKVTFADLLTISMPVARLGIPMGEVDWSSVRRSSDGTALLMRHVSGGTIPIDSAAIRRLVDSEYAAKTTAIVDLLQFTREVGEPLWRECPALCVDGSIVRVGRSRVSLDVVVNEYEQGLTPEGIVRDYDSLKLVDVRRVIAFYQQNRDAVRAYLARRERESEALKARIETQCPPISREELLARLNAKGKGHAAAGQ